MRPPQPGPWSSRPTRPRRPFAVIVGLVFAGVFAVTLAWPMLTDPGRLVSLPETRRAEAVSGPSGAGSSVLSVASPRRGREGFVCNVASVTDGDTLRCREGTRVRLHAVSARERDDRCAPGHPCPTASAAESRSALERLVSGGPLSCERIGSSYDRVTAICWSATGVEINCALVRQGAAALWPRFDRERPICRP